MLANMCIKLNTNCLYKNIKYCEICVCVKRESSIFLWVGCFQVIELNRRQIYFLSSDMFTCKRLINRRACLFEISVDYLLIEALVALPRTQASV